VIRFKLNLPLLAAMLLPAAIPPPAGALAAAETRTRQLVHAASRGDTTDIRSILAGHPQLANASATNSNPVLFAAAGESLLDAGFHVNMPSFGKASHDVFELALSRRIDINDRWPGNGVAWLHHAANGADTLRVLAAIHAGADVNIRTNSGLDDEPMIDAGPELGGVTPLHVAARAGNAAMIGLLLRHGADATLRTLTRRTDPEHMAPWPHDGFLWWSKDPQRFAFRVYKGETPMQLALRFGHDECSTLLQPAGVK